MVDYCAPCLELSGPLLYKSEAELKETESNKKNSLPSFRKTLSKKSKVTGLKTPLDDEFLLLFLRARKFKVSRSVELLMSYYKVRHENEDIFTDFTPSSVRYLFEEGIVVPLKRTVPLRPLCILVRVEKWDIEKLSIEDIFKAMLITIEQTVREDASNQVLGYNFIFDMAGLHFNHVTQFTPLFARRALNMLENAFPARVKGLHHINVPTIVDGVFQVFKPFLSEKMKKRFAVTSQSSNFMSDNYPCEEIPDYLGGRIDLQQTNQEWVERILSDEVDQQFRARSQWGFPKQDVGRIHQSEKSSKQKRDKYDDCEIW